MTSVNGTDERPVGVPMPPFAFEIGDHVAHSMDGAPGRVVWRSRNKMEFYGIIEPDGRERAFIGDVLLKTASGVPVRHEEPRWTTIWTDGQYKYVTWNHRCRSWTEQWLVREEEAA